MDVVFGRPDCAVGFAFVLQKIVESRYQHGFARFADPPTAVARFEVPDIEPPFVTEGKQQRIHPGAVAAAKRAGLDLSESTPKPLSSIRKLPPLVVTVCDQAHEELDANDTWLHWSIPDPVANGSKAAFDVALSELRVHITALLPKRAAS